MHDTTVRRQQNASKQFVCEGNRIGGRREQEGSMVEEIELTDPSQKRSRRIHCGIDRAGGSVV